MLADYIYTIVLTGVIIVLILLLILLPIMILIMKKQKAISEKLDHLNDAIFSLNANFILMDEYNTNNYKKLMTKLTVVDSKQTSIKDLIDIAIKGIDKCTNSINANNRRSNKPLRGNKTNGKGNTPPKL